MYTAKETDKGQFSVGYENPKKNWISESVHYNQTTAQNRATKLNQMKSANEPGPNDPTTRPPLPT